MARVRSSYFSPVAVPDGSGVPAQVSLPRDLEYIVNSKMQLDW